ncbi:MAG: phosphopantetheine-binding protein [Deltaproteobacteria bacterium]|jgi:acyl carrier protein|nr:phosphopantetheine-binding protein [Deltaproteobacteria bacterium]
MKTVHMHNDAITERVNSALVEEFELDPRHLFPEAHIRDDLGLDSLDIVDMVIVLEKAFRFKLHNKEPLAKIQTLGDLYAFIAVLRDEGTITAEP